MDLAAVKEQEIGWDVCSYFEITSDKLQLPWTILPSRYEVKLGMVEVSGASLMILLTLYQKQNKNALDAEINYPDVQMPV